VFYLAAALAVLGSKLIYDGLSQTLAGP